MADRNTIDAIRAQQDAYYAAPKDDAPVREGEPTPTNRKYRQILFRDAIVQADGSKVWCDEYDHHPEYVGYIVRELSADGKQTRATDYGPEGRTTGWVDIQVEI